MILRKLIATAIVTFVFSHSHAGPRFANIFGDHAVLQRDIPVTIWGFDAAPESELTLRIGGKDFDGKVNDNGTWSVELPAGPASSEGIEIELIQNNEHFASIKDILYGDIWLAAGQSNMQWQVKAMLKGMPETSVWADSANLPMVRFRRIGDPVLETRDAEAGDLATAENWVPMNPDSVRNFSAVAATFAAKVHRDSGVPIGIIDVSWGGKPIEPFIPADAFTTSFLSKIKSLADSEKLEDLAKLRGGVIIRNPEGYPGVIFNARMAPISRFGLKGFLWYQGESNAGKGEDPHDYRHKMEALLTGWRTRWKNHQLPCYFVQLPSFPDATGWIRMREEQRRSLKIPHTGMAVTIDIRGDDIHPPDKIPVGERLARIALHQNYGQRNLSFSGPLYKSHRVEKNAVHISFQHTNNGLMIGDRPGSGPVRETPEAQLKWFELAGEDGVWHPASARINGSKVIVTSAEVPHPLEVRYACGTTPQGGNLYSKTGLPASPFCSKLDWLPWKDHGMK